MKRRRNGFTLAEVLITLGIIGVVAAMAIPGLITSVHKTTTAIKVKKFYSVVNQAMRLSSIDNGEPEGWILPKRPFNYKDNLKYMNEYFSPYMKLSSCKKVYIPANENSAACAMVDGGAFILCRQDKTVHFFYLTDYALLDKPNFYKDTRHFFTWQLGKIAGTANHKKSDPNFLVPFVYEWDGTYENLKKHPKYGCSRSASNRAAYCSKLLMVNDWKFTRDYPW